MNPGGKIYQGWNRTGKDLIDIPDINNQLFVCFLT